MEGARLQPGTTCYALMLGDEPIGATAQTITAAREHGKPVWDITVHQTLSDGSFDMRDHFIVERSTLLPLRMESDRRAPDPQHIALTYGKTSITGSRQTATGTTAINVPLTGPVWDGNLWGLTFAALPLHAGGEYRLPFWQYDKGFGGFTMRVTGEDPATWALDAGDDPARLMHYTIGKHPRREIGYRAGNHGQRPGDGCKG
jgi:hypothetical protein